MDFEKIKQAVKEVQLEALRLDEENRLEAVIIKADVGKLTALLEDFFGPAAFPAKDKLSAQICETIDGFGGIMPGQTLYYHSDGKDAVFAMLRPWGDGQRTTLKIIKQSSV